MALIYPDIIQTGNPDAYGIVKEVEVTGARVVSSLTELYAISDAILSPSKTNENNDALGQIWYVASNNDDKGSYRLKDWTNRKASGGWEKLIVTGTEIGASGVSSVNNLHGDISIIGDSGDGGLVQVTTSDDTSNEIKISVDTSNLIKKDTDNAVSSFSITSTDSNTDGISFELNKLSLSVNGGSSSVGTGEVIITEDSILLYRIGNGNHESIAIIGSGEEIRGIHLKTDLYDTSSDSLSGSGELLLGSVQGFQVKLLNNTYAFAYDTFDLSAESEGNEADEPGFHYIATRDYVDDKVGNISSNKLTSLPNGSGFQNTLEVIDDDSDIVDTGFNKVVTITNSGSGEVGIGTTDYQGKQSIGLSFNDTNSETSYYYYFPEKSGTVALTSDIPTYTGSNGVTVDGTTIKGVAATTSAYGVVKTATQLTAATDSVPTTATVNTAITTLQTSINDLKTELAGGVVYKGGVTPSVSGTNITLTGAATPIKTGYMYSITSGSITVNDVVYTTGDYIIYKGTESASTTVPQSDVVFINAQDTDVAKLGADNEFTGSNTFTISGNQTFEVTSNDESTTIILNAGTGEFRIDPNEVSMGTDNGIVKCNSNGILLDTTNTPNTKAYYNNKEIATVDQIPDMTNVAYTNKANVFTQQNTFNDSVKIGSITISENTISNESDEYGYESLKLVCSENIDSTSSNLNLVASNNAHINGSGEFKVLVSSNPQNLSNFRMDNNIIRLNNNTNGITITKDIVEFDTVPTIGSGESAKLVATTDQLPTLPEGTKQLPTDGTWTMSDVVNLLNKVAASLGAPVYSA